jgi:ribosomal protein S18 acetylase RimI-like enzyme
MEKRTRMESLEDLEFRLAGHADAHGIAALHADSWRRHYRGAYSDSFLGGDVAADRLAVWTARLVEPDPRACTIVAQLDGALVGFAHTVFDDDPTWGSLLDNLHVAHGHQRLGVGSHLLALTAGAIFERGETSGLYLWVLEQNVASQAFYEACGGQRVERAVASPPGGVPSRLNGSPTKLRYAWRDPTVLLG